MVMLSIDTTVPVPAIRAHSLYTLECDWTSALTSPYDYRQPYIVADYITRHITL